MKNSKNFFRNKTLSFVIAIGLGLFMGWLIFGGNTPHNHEGEISSTDDHVIWTCSMHPQIRSEEPGKCPLCGMDLTPLSTNSHNEHGMDENAIQMSEEAIALANIQTTIVGEQQAIKNIQLYGTVQVDERMQHSQTSHVNGRIEELYVNFTGESVRKGQLIAKIYSPDLLTAQQELLEATKLETKQPQLLEAAKRKLELLKMNEQQINEILTSKTVSPYVNIYASTQGVVIEKNVNQGDYINPGTSLYTIANLSRLWIVFDAYESEIPFLKVGNEIAYHLKSLPNETFTGKIAFINPIVDPISRTAKVRVEVNNTQGLLKPEMYATATIDATLKNQKDNIVIPKSSVLWTGKRSIVYVKNPESSTPSFTLREITLGESLGNDYVVESGLTDGEKVVTNGAYVIDASAQLEGKISMMNMKDDTNEIEEQHIHHLEHKRRER